LALEAEGVDLPPGFSARLFQGGQKKLPVPGIPEDFVPLIAPVHHMVDRPGIFQTQLSRHEITLSASIPSVNSENRHLHVG
jgi:hypothetical protein